MNNKLIVSNWKEVTKSLAVWFPFLVTLLNVILEHTINSGLVPDKFLPVLVLLSAGIGWVIKQRNMRSY